MRTAIRSISAVFSAVLIVLFAAFPASAAKCDLRQKADETIRSWGDGISQTFCVDGITCFRRLSDDEVEDISNRLSKSSRVYLKELRDGRYTYYMAVDLRTDDAAYLRNPDVMRSTSHKLYKRSETMAKRNKAKSPVLMDYTHIVGEMELHYIVYRVTDDLGGASLKGVPGKLYRSASVAELNIDENRMPVLIRVIGLVIGE